MEKYAILNPMNGQYSFVDTESQCIDTLKDICFNFYLYHTHNSPISIVKYLEDGSQIWKTNGEEVIFTKEMLESKANSFVSVNG